MFLMPNYTLLHKQEDSVLISTTEQFKTSQRSHLHKIYTYHRKCIDRIQRQAAEPAEISRMGGQETSRKISSKASICRPHLPVHIK